MIRLIIILLASLYSFSAYALLPFSEASRQCEESKLNLPSYSQNNSCVDTGFYRNFTNQQQGKIELRGTDVYGSLLVYSYYLYLLSCNAGYHLVIASSTNHYCAADYICPDGSIANDAASCPATKTCPNGDIVNVDVSCPTVTCPDGSQADSFSSCPTYTCWNGDIVSNLANCPPEEQCDEFTTTTIENGTQTVVTTQCSADGGACVFGGSPIMQPAICQDDTTTDDGSLCDQGIGANCPPPDDGSGDGSGDDGSGTGGDGSGDGGTGTGGDGSGDGGDGTGGGDGGLGNVSCGSLNCESTQIAVATKLGFILTAINTARSTELATILEKTKDTAFYAKDLATKAVVWATIADAVAHIVDVATNVAELPDMAKDLADLKKSMDDVSGAGGHFEQVKQKLDKLLEENGYLDTIAKKTGDIADKLPLDRSKWDKLDELDKLKDIKDRLPDDKTKWDKLDNLDKLPEKTKYDKLDELDKLKDIKDRLPDDKTKWDKLDKLDRLPEFGTDFVVNLELLITRLLNPCLAWPDLLFCPGIIPVLDPDELQETEAETDFNPTLHGSGQCPPDKEFTVMGHSYSLTFSYVCDFASYLRAIVMAISYLIAARIVIGGTQ